MIPTEISVAEGELKEVKVVAKSEKQIAYEAKLRARYLELVKTAATTLKRNGEPYKAGFASIQFHAETHRWPTKEWKEEAARLYGAALMPSDQETLYA